MDNGVERVFPPEQALRQVQSYAVRLQSRWDELNIPNNDEPVNLITILQLDDAKEERLAICRESPVKERRNRRRDERELLIIQHFPRTATSW